MLFAPMVDFIVLGLFVCNDYKQIAVDSSILGLKLISFDADACQIQTIDSST